MIDTIIQTNFIPEVFRDINGGVAVKFIYSAPAVGTNNSLISAVSAKRLKIVCAFASSNGAALSIVTFKSNNSSNIGWLTLPANTSAGPNVILPFNPAGWFETNTGESLTADITTTQALLAIGYVPYTP